MKKIVTILTLILLISSVFAQRVQVKGQVAGNSKKDFLIGANVVLTQTGSDEIKGTTTDAQGRFTLENIKAGKYTFIVSYIGYEKFAQELNVSTKSIDLGVVSLKEKEVQTNEIEVVGNVYRAVIKEDTTEFNATAFKTNKDAMAEDLVSKIPGVTVVDGKVQAQGEEVKRVLVDGKVFFGDNPTTVLRNMPAEVIDRVQIFDQMSEQSQFTGFDDGNTTKAMNLITRNRISQGTFGNLNAGAGDESKHKVSGNINFFDGDTKISILGMLNNINEQNFSMEDLSGVMSSMFGGRGGGGRGGGGMPMGGGMMPMGGSFGGGNTFFVNASGGLSKTQALGFNYVDKFAEKLNMSTSYFFNNIKNDALSSSDRTTFLGNGMNQNYYQDNLAGSKNINHMIFARLDYQIDEMNSVLFTPRLSIQNNEGSSLTQGKTFGNNNTLINSISNALFTNYEAYNYSSELLYRRRFETRGRTLSLSINNTFKKNDGDNLLNSQTNYYTMGSLSDTLDQKGDLVKDGYGVTASLNYTEPLGLKSGLQFRVAYSIDEEENDQNTYQKSISTNKYSILDTALSNVYKRQFNTQSYSAGYRYDNDTLDINIDLAYNVSNLENNQSFPYNYNLDRNFTSILPSIRFRYNFSREQNLRFFYRTNNNAPSATQLQNVLDNSNPLQLSIGNPNLKQDYRHFMMLRYSSTNLKTLNSFFANFMATFTNDYIGNNTTIATKDTVINNIVLRRGSQLSRPDNIDGQMSLRSFFTYSLPVFFLKSNLNLNFNVNYTKTPGIINDITNNSNLVNYGLGFVLATNFSTDFDVSFSTTASFNNIRNSVRSEYDDNYFNLDTRLKLYWNIYEGIIFQTNVNHKYDSGLPAEYNQNSILWNAYLGKKLFSKDQGEIRVSVYDLLNKNTNVRRNVTDSYIEDTRSNSLGRYFMLSFIYTLRML